MLLLMKMVGKVEQNLGVSGYHEAYWVYRGIGDIEVKILVWLWEKGACKGIVHLKIFGSLVRGARLPFAFNCMFLVGC